MSTRDLEHNLLGCFTCGTVGGSYQEKLGGVIQCGACGEHTVVSFAKSLEILQILKDVELLDEYNELIGVYGELNFDDEEDER